MSVDVFTIKVRRHVRAGRHKRDPHLRIAGVGRHILSVFHCTEEASMQATILASKQEPEAASPLPDWKRLL